MRTSSPSVAGGSCWAVEARGCCCWDGGCPPTSPAAAAATAAPTTGLGSVATAALLPLLPLPLPPQVATLRRLLSRCPMPRPIPCDCRCCCRFWRCLSQMRAILHMGLVMRRKALMRSVALIQLGSSAYASDMWHGGSWYGRGELLPLDMAESTCRRVRTCTHAHGGESARAVLVRPPACLL
jgi:hypothetical protein